MEHTALPMRIEEYASRMGLKMRHQTCPFCGSKTAFSISAKKQVFNCLSTSCPANGGGNVLTLCALLENCSTKEAYRKLKEMSGDTNYTPPVTHQKAQVESDAPIADIDVRHNTYTTLLSFLSLDEKHIGDLRARGFEKTHRYKTYDLSADDRERLCRLLLSKGCVLQGVPGFYINAKGNWTLAYSKRAILVPYRNKNGLIQGLQLRKDNKVLKSGENKYTWLSSSYLPNGSKPGSGTAARTFVHYASFKMDNDTGMMKHSFQDGVCFLTEGAMKADLANEIIGQGFIAVPGVNALTRLENEFDSLKSYGVRKIVNAYDMDYITNPNVADAVAKTRQSIEAAGFEYSRLVWDDHYKGIDDFYAAKVRGINQQ